MGGGGGEARVREREAGGERERRVVGGRAKRCVLRRDLLTHYTIFFSPMFNTEASYF